VPEQDGYSSSENASGELFRETTLYRIGKQDVSENFSHYSPDAEKPAPFMLGAGFLQISGN